MVGESRYQELMRRAREHVVQYEEFEQRGKSAVVAALGAFCTYLGAPPATCRLGPPDVSFDETRIFRPDELVILREDGHFAGAMIVAGGPQGPFMRFTFYVRVDGDSLVFQSGDRDPIRPEFRAKEVTAETLTPLFESVLAKSYDMFATAPDNLVSGSTLRPIGFVT